MSLVPVSCPLPLRSRMGRLLVALPMLAVGVTLLLRADLGVAPFDVFNSGVSDSAGMPFPLAYLVGSFLFFALGTALGARPGWASVAGALVVSGLLQVFLVVASEPETLAPRVVMLCVGLPIIAVAICLVITTELGAGPIEVFMLGLIRHGVPVARARWLAEGATLAIGAAIGGAVGVGTLVFALVIGPLVAAGLRVLRYRPPVKVT